MLNSDINAQFEKKKSTTFLLLFKKMQLFKLFKVEHLKKIQLTFQNIYKG